MRGVAPLVSMVNSTGTVQSDNLGRGCRAGLDSSWFRGVLVESQVAPIDVAVRNVLGQQAAQMSLGGDDHVVEKFPNSSR